jgi:NADH-quinone oxidoreductase subunit J
VPEDHVITLAVFIIFAVLAVGAAVLVIIQKNVMHSVLYLAFTVLATAGVFFTLGAEYLGAIIIIVYLKEIVPDRRRFLPKLFLIAVPVALGAELAYLLFFKEFHAAAGPREGAGFKAVAETLFSSYLFPFELASILLLAVLVGAIIVARRTLIDDPH